MIKPDARLTIKRIPLECIQVRECQERYPNRLLHYIQLLKDHPGEDAGLLFVQPSKTHSGMYELLDGHHKFCAAIMAGRHDVLCLVVEDSAEEAQVKAEEGFAIHPLQVGEEIALKDLRPGAVFMTSDGKYAVKSKHYSGTSPYDQYECILLASGEYAQFTDGNWTRVREVRMCK
jgi:hypothetical protein